MKKLTRLKHTLHEIGTIAAYLLIGVMFLALGCGKNEPVQHHSETNSQAPAEATPNQPYYSTGVTTAVQLYAEALEAINAGNVSSDVQDYARAIKNKKIVHSILDVYWTNECTYTIITNKIAGMSPGDVLDITETMPDIPKSFTNASAFALELLYEYVLAEGDPSQQKYALLQLDSLYTKNSEWTPVEWKDKIRNLMISATLSDNPTQAEKNNYKSIVVGLFAGGSDEAILRMRNEQETGKLEYPEQVLATTIMLESQHLSSKKRYDEAKEVLLNAVRNNTYNFRKYYPLSEEQCINRVNKQKEFYDAGYKAWPAEPKENPLNKYNPNKTGNNN